MESATFREILAGMSEENVELARQYVEAFNRGGLDATEDLRHPDIEVFDPPNFPDADRHVGEAAVRKLVESYLAIGWNGQFDVQEYIDAGDEAVVIWHLTGTSGGGGVPLDVPALGHVYAFQDDKLRRLRQYLTRAEALEATGLSE
jgi:ketosteroid isomerase-like protein